MGKLIWLASYPKSGNTFCRALLHNYFLPKTTPHDINALADICAVEAARGFFGHCASIAQVQRARPAVHERLTRLGAGPVFVKTHNANIAVENVALCTPEFTAGAIYIVRDPRDVAVSYASYLGQEVEEVITFMGNARAALAGSEAQVFEFLGSWSDHAKSWVAAPNRVLVRYEDLLANPAKTFARVLRFLRATPDARHLKQAITFSSFEELAGQERKAGYRAAGTAQKFFRSGRAGAWRDVLTPAQAERIAQDHAEIMRSFGYL